MNSRKTLLGDSLFFYDYDYWKYLQAMNYSQFLKVSVLEAETPFVHKDHKYNETIKYFPFGPSLSAFNNAIFYISGVSLQFFSIFFGKNDDINFFAESKHSYGYAEKPIRRLLKKVQIAPGLDKVMAGFLSEKFHNEAVIKDTEFFKDLFQLEWDSFIEEGKHFLKRKQAEIYINLFDECNNTAIYLPRVTANEVARKVRCVQQI